MADDTRSRAGAKAVSGLVGVVLAAVAGVFVVRALLRDREEIGDALDQASAGWLVAGFVLAVVGMTAISLPWRRAVRLLGGDLPLGQLVARYYVGEIGKYVPGGVWPILGRGELARRRGVRSAAAYGSVALSLAALYLAAMFVVVATMPVLLAGDDGTGPVFVVLLLPVGLIVLHPRVLGALVRVVERVTRRTVELNLPSWRQSVALVGLYVPAWLAIGAATWAVARALDPDADLLRVGAAAVLSWVIGFVLVPVPGGVGVREAAFVAAAGSLEPGIAAAAALAARAVFVVVDAGGAAVGALVIRRSGGSVQAAWTEDTE